jgi:HD-GYP domain-containing protein (c-di-GMP phosphodiesterase class II)
MQARTDVSSYLPIKVETIRTGTTGMFDLFLRPQRDKMVLYHRSGDEFTPKVKDKLLSNNVKTLYIYKGDRDNYLSYIEENLNGLIDNPNLSVTTKATMTHRSVSRIAYNLFKKPEGSTITRFKSVISGAVDLISKETQALSSLLQMTEMDYATYNHSINVGFFALALTNDMFNLDKATIKRLAHAFFLHDIGKSGMPLSLLHKRGKYTDEEWNVMTSHPSRGFRLLSELNALNDESRIVIMQHHERHDGTGYPKGLFGDQIHVYAKICTIADVFDALTSPRPHKRSNSTFEALKIMKNEMYDEFDPAFFAHFVRLFSKKNFLVKQEQNERTIF